jgi:hypothetical protein
MLTHTFNQEQTMATDFPLLRAFHQCPLCGNDKPISALTCWPCFNEHHVGDSAEISKWAEVCIGLAEANLMTAAG